MRPSTIISALVSILLSGCASIPGKDISQNPFLQPYVGELKKDTPSVDLNRIRDMGKSELVLLLHGYGTWIRNKWIHGNRDPKLVKFFHENGVDDPEGASMVIIEALWYDLNSNLTPADEQRINAKRALVVRKRSAYEKLELECRSQLAKDRDHFESCYQQYGLPSSNPQNRDPFFTMTVERSGRVKKIDYFTSTSSELKDCLERRLRQFKFSSFLDDEAVTLYILEFPNCRVAERDTLHY